MRTTALIAILYVASAIASAASSQPRPKAPSLRDMSSYERHMKLVKECRAESKAPKAQRNTLDTRTV